MAVANRPGRSVVKSLPVTVGGFRIRQCRHLGERLAGQPCGSSLFRCDLFRDVTSLIKPCAEAARDCQSCTSYI